MPRTLVATALALGLTACGQSGPRGTTPGTMSDAQRRAGLVALCLAAPDEDDTQAGRLTGALEEARIRGAQARWAELGGAWIEQARRTFREGYYLHAEACAELGERATPDDVAGPGLRAMVQLNRHDFRTAAASASAVLATHPRDQRALGVLSDALLELGDVDGAVGAAQRMVDVKPNLPSYARAAHLAWLQGDAPAAKRFYRQAIASAANGEPRAWVLVEAAEVFRHEGDVDGADAGYLLALAVEAEYPPALVGRARVAMARGDAALAVSLLERAARVAPLVQTWWLLGDAHAAAGHPEAAARAYERVERDGRAHDQRTLARFLATTGGDAQDALRLAEAELRTRPGVYTRDTCARALLAAGKAEDARRILAPLEAVGVLDADLLVTRARALHATGNVAGGRGLLADALAHNPNVDTRGVEELLPHVHSL